MKYCIKWVYTHSEKEIQQELFDLGFTWFNSRNYSKTDTLWPYLYVDLNDKKLSHSMRDIRLIGEKVEDITLDDLKKLIHSGECLKCGDKVYFGEHTLPYTVILDRKYYTFRFMNPSLELLHWSIEPSQSTKEAIEKRLHIKISKIERF